MKHACLFSFKGTALIIIILFWGTSQITYAQKTRNVSFSKSSLQMNILNAEDGVDYQKIKMKNLQLSGAPGQPDLPVKYIRLLIPPNQDVANIVVNVKNAEVIKLEKKIYPAQPGIPTSTNFQGNQFVKPDPNIYDSDKPWPSEIVKVKHDGYFDGTNHIVTLEVYPIRYYPKLDYAEFYPEIEFALNMQGSSKQPLKTPNRNEKYKDMYDNALRYLIDNEEDISMYSIPRLNKNTSVASGPLPAYEYVVITTNARSQDFNKFINWKKRKGLDIGLVTVEQIYVNYNGDLISGINDDAGKIRQYLYDSYIDGTVWVLLGGDYSVVPVRYGTGSNDTWTVWATEDYMIPTDIYFSDFNGDWDVDGVDGDGIRRYGEPTGDSPDYDPEIFVGRLLCSTSQEIINWTNKLILYEQDPGKGDNGYLTQSFMFESDQMQDGQEAEGVVSAF